MIKGQNEDFLLLNHRINYLVGSTVLVIEQENFREVQKDSGNNRVMVAHVILVERDYNEA